MPSIPHEALVLLFRNRPELAPELLRDVLGVALPAYAEARVEAADLSDVIPAEYRADLVVLLVDGQPVLAIVVEAQLQKDERKPFSWPVYLAGLRALRVPRLHPRGHAERVGRGVGAAADRGGTGIVDGPVRRRPESRSGGR
jgi:hypothetical protein